MSGILDTARSCLLDGDYCDGSGQPAPLESATLTTKAWTGYCPACDRRVKLGYAGIVPQHSRLEAND